MHNPRCRKSREALQLLESRGLQPTVVEYLKTPLTTVEIKELLAMLDMPAEALIRKGESIYKELYKGKVLSEEEWIAAMVAHPVLIDRPIVIKDGKAVVGRPLDKVEALL